MYEQKIRKLMHGLKKDRIKVDDAVKKLKFMPFEDLGFAKIDHHRALRKGFPEVVYCQNKTIRQVANIIKKLNRSNMNILATRATKEMYNEVKKQNKNAKYNESSKTIIIQNNKNKRLNNNKITILSAGTSDINVAEEAAIVAEVMGNKVERLYDVGVAGLHRLLNNKEKLEDSSVLVVVAGMDGVLPSVVSGIFGKPIIAVPTSVGYGASFKGIAPLLTMLNSCSPGVVVVNIDNGFGAGYFASMINK
ncbi:1-(5-phosphoribosyl)-5-amino-4-imidazole-carboxylate carboxylase [Candidatus Woesearchaeota archaeon]|nr:1-(5-phosphoribosyl)-5-amino-4-imidazole-carboxylate carboxylase [Candidatus Woesearchaeota archaeon]|tara:strand:- start:2379 stop:3125 length:747 start_codon:yes stop_codon:yes gene_type:complete